MDIKMKKNSAVRYLYISCNKGRVWEWEISHIFSFLIILKKNNVGMRGYERKAYEIIEKYRNEQK